MNRGQGFDRLTLDDDLILNDNICSKTDVQLYFVIFGGDPTLYGDGQASISQFMRESCLIYVFEKTGTEGRVDLECTVDNDLCELIFVHGESSRKAAKNAKEEKVRSLLLWLFFASFASLRAKTGVERRPEKSQRTKNAGK